MTPSVVTRIGQGCYDMASFPIREAPARPLDVRGRHREREALPEVDDGRIREERVLGNRDRR